MIDVNKRLSDYRFGSRIRNVDDTALRLQSALLLKHGTEHLTVLCDDAPVCRDLLIADLQFPQIKALFSLSAP